MSDLVTHCMPVAASRRECTLRTLTYLFLINDSWIHSNYSKFYPLESLQWILQVCGSLSQHLHSLLYVYTGWAQNQSPSFRFFFSCKMYLVACSESNRILSLAWTRSLWYRHVAHYSVEILLLYPSKSPAFSSLRGLVIFTRIGSVANQVWLFCSPMPYMSTNSCLLLLHGHYFVSLYNVCLARR